VAEISPEESARRLEAIRQEAPLQPAASPFPIASQVQRFMTRMVDIDSVSKVPEQGGPLEVRYHEGMRIAELPPGLRRAGDPALETPPAPPAPTEAALREVLTQCIAAKSFADANLQRAQETSDRAAKHAERCRGGLASFTGLDDEITAAAVEALRGGEGRPRHDFNDELRRRAASRDVAKADADAATRAEQVLARDLEQTKADAPAAAKAARTAAVAVAGVAAARKAERHDELVAEAARIREGLAGFDRAATGSGATIPHGVLRVLRDPRNSINLMREIDASAWQAVIDRLLTDPEVQVEIG
jgi:hypothetical protein